MKPKDVAQLWFVEKKVHLIIPKAIEFHDLNPVEAIQRVKLCVGLSESERDQIIKAIYYHGEPKKRWEDGSL